MKRHVKFGVTLATVAALAVSSAQAVSSKGLGLKSKRNYRDSSLAEIAKNPKSFLQAQVKFDAYFIQRGDLYRPFYTPLLKDTYVNFHVWADGAELWTAEARKMVFPFLYIPRKDLKLQNLLDELKLFQSLRIYGEVVSANGDHPWVLVDRIELIEDALNFNDNSIKNLAIGIEMANRDEHDLAVRRFSTALNEGMPPVGQLAALRHMGLSLYRLKRYDQAEAVLKLVVARQPNDANLLLRLGQSVLELATSDKNNIDPYRLEFARDTLSRVTRIEPGDVMLDDIQT